MTEQLQNTFKFNCYQIECRHEKVRFADRHYMGFDTIYKFIHNTVGQYVHTYTKLHTCTIKKHTYQGQYRIKYFHKYRYK